MQKRKLGRSNLEIAPLIFGGNVFGWTVDEKGSFALLDAFLDAGFNCIDTADVYSRWVPGHKGGESEAIIGNWFKARGKRSKVILATKCGLEMAPDKKGLSKAYIVRAVEASLKRLQTDYIDLYQSHRDDPETPLEETMAAHAELVKAGKVRVVGASNYSADRLKAALAASAKLGIPRYETLQPNYNLADRTEFEGPLQDLCVAEGISVIPYYSLASGFLTGKYRSEADLGQKARAGGVKKHLTPRGLGILKALDTVAAKHGATPAQVALAWLLAQPAIAAPIASATTTAQLAEILKCAELKLSADDLAALSKASA
ncbi:aldo/keto reductase [Hyphomicrobium sp. CS1BSMeth3]|uniref:aldo/keto reductase n=1 Tax=Hyphomicrobium sp. CS1BSMeth3 TaxID=1892844 RepID=UPI000931FD91|nr:aldo/keto reductase [Hyphomicrobium sp. CS1BSMeth3]